jgi:hypothetical protein
MTPQQFEHLTDRELLLLTAQKVDDLVRKSDDQGGRIVLLETWRTFLSGSFAVISLLFWCAWDYIVNGGHGRH